MPLLKTMRPSSTRLATPLTVTGGGAPGIERPADCQRERDTRCRGRRTCSFRIDQREQ